MRQIIHTQLVSNLDGSHSGTRKIFDIDHQHRGDNSPMGILTDDLSSLRTNPNESIDSSFEVPTQSYLSSKSKHMKSRNDRSIQSARETSWDAVFNDSKLDTSSNDNVGGRYHPKSITRSEVTPLGRVEHESSSSAVVTPSPCAQKTMGRPRKYMNRTQQQQPEEMTSVSAISSADNSRTTGGSRISRLASLFSSRAIMTSESVPPLSPPRSESSTGYVGWPGTQDKQGATVVAESSYEESEFSSDKVKGYQQEVQKNVDRELTEWIDGGGGADLISDDEYSLEKSKLQMKSSRIDRDKIHRLAEGKYPSPLSSESPLQTHINSGINFIQTNGRESKTLDHIIQEQKIHLGANSSRNENFKSTNISTKQWDDDMSDLSTSYSKTSSAYFNPREVQAIQKGHTKQLIGINQNRLAAATVMRRCLSSSAKWSQQPHQKQSLQSLTEDTLAMKNHYSPPVRNFNNAATVGFRGLLDRSQDVPNLMDESGSDSISAVSASTSLHSSVFVQDRYNTSNSNNNENEKTDQYISSSSPSLSSTYYRHKQQKQRQQRHGTIIEEEISSNTDVLNCGLLPPDNNNCVTTRDQADVESDIFDGISNQSQEEDGNVGILGATSRASMEKINLALLGGGLTTIQTTNGDFTNRKTASDFDETLTNSDYDQHGFAKIPAFHKMASAGMNHHDRSLSSQSLLFACLPSQKYRPERQNQKDHISEQYHYPVNTSAHNKVEDFSEYYVLPEEMQNLVKKFRKISRSRYSRLDYEDLEKEEDSTKAFALSEMRSRIMEKDIERGLERRGGTTVVDDIVMTSYNKAALRVRDAVIVAKAWRDGATPQDIINTANLTRRTERCYCIPRLESTARGASKYTWEEVNWVDDNELSQYRCHSIGPRHLKGVEMFTIGDCQSILLKLCNERCQELRDELNDATADQIEAEGLMKDEGETETFDGMMTEAEMTYLTSMEAVKSLSQKLVLAEKAFTLVRKRIEKLVAKYEALLVRFECETESVAPSSVLSFESSCYSENYSFVGAKESENEALVRRAQRAELHAEVVAREFMLTSQEVKAARIEKEKELNDLKIRLADLQSESSVVFTERDRSVILARAITRTNQTNRRSSGGVGGELGGRCNSRLKIDDIKKRFRDRSAANFQFNSGKRLDDNTLKQTSPNNNDNGNSFHRTVGEEMFQHLDFYERSLKAVKESN
mmetsp:Transcript_22908/g.25538  ORF Transcript_22908/g.25538 Transcript_22908/m.25538 type:complete len:1192 (+) Transcript_22908:91-3666(+)